ncbi:MAG: carboxypeptidase-like regulatory domain-containing protein, partial [Thioalkalivibrio sp.]|nr:carboxypeptidase-like regulatory domain-containing protein [Thioalkalivibrio sp.]
PNSIPDPRMVSARAEVVVRVPPASFGRLDIAVTPSQELWGTVVRVTPEGEMPLGYAELELVDVRTGETRAVRAFSDGEFYEIGVRPGRYEIRVAPGSLRGLGVVPEQDAYPVEIQAGAGAEAPDAVRIRLVPVAGVPGSPGAGGDR